MSQISRYENPVHTNGQKAHVPPVRMFVRPDDLRTVEFNGGGGAGYWKVPAGIDVTSVAQLRDEAVEIARAAGYLMVGEWRAKDNGEHIALLIPSPSADRLLAECVAAADRFDMVVTSAELGPDPEGPVFLRVEFSLPHGYSTRPMAAPRD